MSHTTWFVASLTANLAIYRSPVCSVTWNNPVVIISRKLADSVV